MPIRVLGIASDEKDPLLVEARAYLGRCSRRYQAELVLLSPGRRKKSDDDAAVRANEGQRLWEASGKSVSRPMRIALDAKGKTFDSVAFTKRLERWLADGRSPSFLIGGATGHDPGLLERADEKLSLSTLTLPHKLAMLVMAEQIYRAHEIARGGPYHK